jgi:hypothetical protein
VERDSGFPNPELTGDLAHRWRWRSLGQLQAQADALLPKLLLSINAIASGLRTMG